MTPSAQVSKTISLCQGSRVTLSAKGFGSYLWSTGAVSDSIVVNSAATYTLHTLDSSGCNIIDSFFVNSYNNPVINLVKDTSFCTEGIINAGSGYQNYLWNTGSTEQSITITNPGLYWVSITDANGCEARDTVNIAAIYATPSNFLIADTSMCINSPITIGSLKEYPEYLWSNGAVTPQVSINSPGSYWLKVTDSNKCSAYDTVTVSQIDCYSNIIIPNAFSPNGDGINDTWHIKDLDKYPNASVEVFDRYGQTIFRSIGYNKEWDGKYNGRYVPIGTYYYIISVAANYKPFSGSVTILK